MSEHSLPAYDEMLSTYAQALLAEAIDAKITAAF